MNVKGVLLVFQLEVFGQIRLACNSLFIYVLLRLILDLSFTRSGLYICVTELTQIFAIDFWLQIRRVCLLVRSVIARWCTQNSCTFFLHHHVRRLEHLLR